MTKDQVTQLVLYYRDHLAKLTFEVEHKLSGISSIFKTPTIEQVPIGEPKRWLYDCDENGNRIPPARMEALQHARWMAQEILTMIESDKSEGKVFRWLGFLQGVFWTLGIFTVEEMRRHNVTPTDPS